MNAENNSQKFPDLLKIPIWFFFWVFLTITPFFTRTFMPIDETRYVSVAWDMHLRGDYLVPHMNGQPYSEKPPLLFWIINLGWAALGINDIWPRLVSPIFGALSLLLTARIAGRLRSYGKQSDQIAPLITVSSGSWMIFMPALMFDMPLVFFTLLAVWGIIRIWQDGDWKGWLVAGIAIGFGLLSKGPVILVHTMPLALLAPWWAIDHRPRNWLSWYAGIMGAVLLGAAIALSWALPAARAGGEAYARAIFWGQSAGRVVNAFAHERPFWWYVALLPLLFFPWAVWPALWRGFKSLFQEHPSSAVRFCIAWGVPVFIIFSVISGKQVHYLLPLGSVFGIISSFALVRYFSFRRYDALLPGAFILAAGTALCFRNLIPLKPSIVWLLSSITQYLGPAIAATGVLFLASYLIFGKKWGILLVPFTVMLMVVIIYAGGTRVMAKYDVRDLSGNLGKLQRTGIPLAHVGKYNDTFKYLGRMEMPIDVINREDVLKWIEDHPDGRIIAEADSLQPYEDVLPEYEYQFGLKTLKVWRSSSFVKDK